MHSDGFIGLVSSAYSGTKQDWSLYEKERDENRKRLGAWEAAQVLVEQKYHKTEDY